MFDSYKQFVRMGHRKGKAKKGDMKRYNNYLGDEHVLVVYNSIGYETNKAVQLKIKGKLYWFPRSKTTIYILNNTVEMPKWMATSHGFDTIT